MKFIAFIPARSGSKGIKEKNLAILDGKPLISHTINSSLASNKIDDIYISSDSKKILDVVDNSKIKKIRRDKSLADDNTTANDVLKNFISLNSIEISDNTYIVYLQPTSPLRKSFHIDKSINLLLSLKGKSLISVKESKELPYKALKKENERLIPIFDEKEVSSNRQSLPKTFYPNGAIYIFTTQAFIENDHKIPIKNSIPFIMDDNVSIDIDTKDDLLIAEKILNP